MSAPIIKILVTGDVDGNFKELTDRVSAVNRKNGPFHMLLCAGNFFPRTFIESCSVPSSPIPTYILGPVEESQVGYFSNLTGCEIGENITYLGQRGVYNESSGLKIAYFSGTECQNQPGFNASINFNYEDVRNLEIRLNNESGFQGVDILLTSQWPHSVENKTAQQPAEKPVSPSPLLSRLAMTLKPRYHFTGLEGIHYERAPYRNHKVLAESAQHPSRFIALSKVGNTKKQKWLYAFNICPMKQIDRAELVREPPNITESPYSNVNEITNSSLLQNQEKSIDRRTAAPTQYFFDSSYDGQPTNRRDNRKRHNNDRFSKNSQGGQGGPPHPAKRPPPGPCWFCLASPEVEKHLIISIGDSTYTTLAKGGLTTDHVLILPIGHFQSTIECPQDVLDELAKFKASLKKLYASQGKGVVFFERNFKSPHLQIQAVPIPSVLVPNLKSLCLDYAESEEIEIQEFPANAELYQMTKSGFPYFYLELPDSTKLFVQIRRNFPLQFGRELLASDPILNVPDKIDWKQCKVTKDEEIQLTLEFRNSFKPFDFTCT